MVTEVVEGVEGAGLWWVSAEGEEPWKAGASA